MLGAMRAILARPHDLCISALQFDVDRFVGRDSGMVRTGPSMVGLPPYKDNYEKVILIWDHHGSGMSDPLETQEQVQAKLNDQSWTDRSSVVAIVPELEEWLWCDPDALCRFYAKINQPIAKELLDKWVAGFAKEHGRSTSDVKRVLPKELFEHIVKVKIRRSLSPAHYEKIAELADLSKWEKSDSFASLVSVLRHWFPQRPTLSRPPETAPLPSRLS